MTNDTGAVLRSHYESQGGTASVFSGKVADYVQSRPDYPRALIDALIDLLPDDGQAFATVADIGAGTGLLTAPLLVICRVVAIEPNDEMRAACDHLLGHHARYASRAGTAEHAGLPDASVDLITAAQAFHWFDIEPARREALRILRPHGQVALIWNDRVRADPLHVALDALFAEYGGARREAMARQDERSSVPSFFGGPYRQQVFRHEHRLDRAGLLALAFSRSYMPTRDSETGRKAAESIGAVFDRFATAGQVAVRYNSVLMCGRPVAVNTPTRQETDT